MTIPESGWVITLDGPAGSGKSTTARLVADNLDFVYLDTGALYRAITVLAMMHGVSPEDNDALAELVGAAGLAVQREGNDQRILSQDGDLTDRLRTAEVDRHVSAVSAVPEVRTAMLAVQRAQRSRPGLVAEGRDLGTVVFPDADLKVYLVAELDVRAERRAKQRQADGELASVESEKQALKKRDELDTTRTVAPLAKPADAVEVDTTNLTIDGQVGQVIGLFDAVRKS